MNKKQLIKKIDKKCYFCEENDYNLLDCHRILPGEQGGKYKNYNILTLCSNCHRKCHSGKIEILGKYDSTSGKTIVIYKEDGVEKIK